MCIKFFVALSRRIKTDTIQSINQLIIYIYQTEVRGTRYEIQGLKSAAAYDIVVASVNSRGSSLPELTLKIVTEGMLYVTLYNDMWWISGLVVLCSTTVGKAMGSYPDSVNILNHVPYICYKNWLYAS